MALKRCRKNREQAPKKRRQLRDEKVAHLSQGYAAGDQGDCQTLHSLLGSEAHREQNRFKPGLHRRA